MGFFTPGLLSLRQLFLKPKRDEVVITRNCFTPQNHNFSHAHKSKRKKMSFRLFLTFTINSYFYVYLNR